VGTGLPVLDAVKVFEEAGVATFVYTDTTRDGTLAGPDLEGLRRLTEATDLPIIASGGVSSLEDLRAVARMYPDGVNGAVVGRALYEHKFTLGEAQFAADEAAEGRAELPLVEGQPFE
jgi:phosphoribosylanthranilate isomerase